MARIKRHIIHDLESGWDIKNLIHWGHRAISIRKTKL